MDFSKIFQHLLGIPAGKPSHTPDRQNPSDFIPNGNEFRNPIWNEDGDDDDDDDLRTPNSTFSFNVFTNPLEMHRFFEHQLGEIIRSFQSQMPELLPPGFGPSGFPALERPDDGAEPGDSGHGSLRDKYLKPSYETAPKRLIPWFSRDKKSDTDLDDRIRKGGLESILGNHDASEPLIVPPKPRNEFQTKVFGKSVVSQTVRRPDGSVEHRRTVRDNHGNEETTVTRQVGEQSYSVTTQLDPSGVEKRTENYVNIDEAHLPEFEEKWKTGKGSVVEPGSLGTGKPHNWFPFDKFFK